MELRPMTAADDVMPFVVAAMNWRGDALWDAAAVLSDPAVAHYATGWMRAGDAGVAAVESGTVESGAVVGAAWWRHFTSDDPGYGYVADDVPEIGLAVLAPHQGRGVGTALLRALIARARAEGVRAVSLSVESGNEVARSMYERSGFTPHSRVGDADTMVLALK